MQIAGGKVLNAAEEAFNNGQYEEAQGLIEGAVKNGIIRSDLGEQKINDLIRNKRSEDYTALVTQNPKAAIDDLEAAGPEGDSHLFPDTKPSERVRWLGAAKLIVFLTFVFWVSRFIRLVRTYVTVRQL